MKMLSKYLIAATIGLTAVSAPVAAFAADLYGSIAYSQSSRNYAWATDYNSQYEAENAAMNECYKRAGDCKSALWFVNGCGALAVGDDGGWGSNWGTNFREAQNKAISQCNGVSYNCKVVITKCVSGY
jgi:serine/threonine-protein kinase